MPERDANIPDSSGQDGRGTSVRWTDAGERDLDDPDSWLATRVPGLPFYVVSWVIVGVEVARYLLTADRMLIDTAELALLGFIGVVYALLGHRITQRVPWRRRVRIAATSALLGVAGVLLSGVTVVFARLAGDPVFEETFLLLFGGAATAITGLIVGYYYHQFQARYHDLEREYERTKRLSRELSITHRVLRHNLRNELTAIEGYLEMARGANGSAPDDVAEHLDVVETHIDDINDICEKAGELSKITPDSNRYPQDAVEALETAVEHIEERFPAADIETATPPSAPVEAHPRLPTALAELLENAVEHNDPETVDVTARIDRAASPDGETQIEIADSGSGIPDMEVENLQQGEEQPLSHGQGLGLWVVNTVVEHSDGDLSFRRSSPSGTVAAIELDPARHATVPEDPPTDDAP